MGRLSLALVLVAVLAALVGTTAAYVRFELAEPEAFADRAVEALRSEDVREAIAEQVAVEIVERGAPDLVASRPLVLAAVEAVLETEAFGRVMRRAAISAHRLLLLGDRDVIVELEEARAVLVPAVESVSPAIARQIPADLSPTVAQIRRSDGATWVLRVSESARVLAVPLLAAALALLGLAVAVSRDARRSAVVAGGAVGTGAVVGLVAVAVLRAQVVSHGEQVGVLSAEASRDAAGAAWDALAGGLELWLTVMALIGLAIVAGGFLAEVDLDRARALRRATDVIAGGSPRRGIRALRGIALIALGGLLLAGVRPATTVALVLVGLALVLLGSTEALSTISTAARVRRPRRRRRGLAVAAGAVAVAAAVVAVGLTSAGGPPATPEEEEIVACNGHRTLCDRRLDEAAFPGTHNSMSAADRPGWFFANQLRPIPRQLDDGIRLLMIDAHYGIVDAQGRVRTDLTAEGTDRNRVARRLGAEAVRVAERLAGRLDLVPAEGEREIFLCHTLCELGAERMSAALDDIRGFLERNPSEVLIVVTESSVAADEVEREVTNADLEPYVATLRRDAPLPTLSEMIASGRRLVLLDQGDGGDEPWYHPGYVFFQGTSIRALLRSSTACEVGRGTPDSPLFLLNHWIDRFPPPLTENAGVSDRETLERRIETCREQLGRTPNLVAVDFYDRTAVLAVADALNQR